MQSERCQAKLAYDKLSTTKLYHWRVKPPTKTAAAHKSIIRDYPVTIQSRFDDWHALAEHEGLMAYGQVNYRKVTVRLEKLCDDDMLLSKCWKFVSDHRFVHSTYNWVLIYVVNFVTTVSSIQIFIKWVPVQNESNIVFRMPILNFTENQSLTDILCFLFRWQVEIINPY